MHPCWTRQDRTDRSGRRGSANQANVYGHAVFRQKVELRLWPLSLRVRRALPCHFSSCTVPGFSSRCSLGGREEGGHADGYSYTDTLCRQRLPPPTCMHPSLCHGLHVCVHYTRRSAGDGVYQWVPNDSGSDPVTSLPSSTRGRRRAELAGVSQTMGEGQTTA